MTTREQITDRLQQMNQDAKELSRSMWLASLGTVGMVDEASRDLWNRLVERGKKVDFKVDFKGEKIWDNEVLKPVREAGERANGRFTETRERVERSVEDNMTEVLHRLGAPSRRDVQDLIDRIEKLTHKVEGLEAA